MTQCKVGAAALDEPVLVLGMYVDVAHKHHNGVAVYAVSFHQSLNQLSPARSARCSRHFCNVAAMGEERLSFLCAGAQTG